jgi:Spy/CpxP family protein refolding chaperone
MNVLALFVVAGASFAVASAISSRQVAGNCSVGMGRGMGQGMPLVTGYLQLTAEQESRIAPINEAFRAEQGATCADVQESRAELLSVLKQPKPTREDIDAALADHARAQAKLQRHAAQYLLEIKPLLTEDQRDRLFDLVGQKFCGQGRCGVGCEQGMGMRGRN